MTSLLRATKWPDFNGTLMQIPEYHAHYGDMIVSVVLKLVAVAAAAQYYFKQMLSFH